MIQFIAGYVLGVLSLMALRVILLRLNRIAKARAIEKEMDRVRKEIDELTEQMITVNKN
jgi:uncharacterized membrane-anchored protein YhcB (DUF1043 family)